MTFLRILLVIVVTLAGIIAAVTFSMDRNVPDVAGDAVEEVQEAIGTEDEGEDAETVDAQETPDEPVPSPAEDDTASGILLDEDDPAGVTAAVAEEFPLENMINAPAAAAIRMAREAIVLADKAGDEANKAIANIAVLMETDPVAAAKDADRVALVAVEAAEAATAAAQEALTSAGDATELAEATTNEYRAQSLAEAKEARDAADEAVSAALDAEAYAREAVTAAEEASLASEQRIDAAASLFEEETPAMDAAAGSMVAEPALTEGSGLPPQEDAAADAGDAEEDAEGQAPAGDAPSGDAPGSDDSDEQP